MSTILNRARVPRRWRWGGIILLLWMATASGLPAAERLTIRMVLASNQGQGCSPQLRDVAPLLERNLPYRRFDQEDSRTVRLPVSETVAFASGISVRCDGDENRLSLVVQSGGLVLLQTQVRLTGKTPLILGGFPAPSGRRMLILTAH